MTDSGKVRDVLDQEWRLAADLPRAERVPSFLRWTAKRGIPIAAAEAYLDLPADEEEEAEE